MSLSTYKLFFCMAICASFVFVVLYGSVCFSEESVKLNRNIKSEFSKNMDDFEKQHTVVSLESALGNIRDCYSSSFTLNNSEKSTVLKDVLDLSMQLLNQISIVFDSDFNAEDKPLMNICPPGDTIASSGTDPKSIKDSNIRMQYEKMLADNKIKSENYIFQTKLRDINVQLKKLILEAVVYQLSLEDKTGTPSRKLLLMLSSK